MSLFPTNYSINLSQNVNNWTGSHVARSERGNYNRKSRMIALVVLFFLSFVGNLIVIKTISCSWVGKQRKGRRVHMLFVNLAMADLSVSLLTVLSQILWESLGSEWLAGDLSCRLVKVAQIFGLTASSNMVVIIALERQHAIANPLAILLSVTKICAASWICAVLFSVPQAFVFRETKLNSGTQCLGIFDNLPKWHFQMYIIYGAMVVFFVPFCIFCFAYARILCIIWKKEKKPKREKVVSNSTTTGTQFHLNPTNSSLPKAKVKTLKMTLMIILLFIICGLPYFVVEMKFAFGNVSALDQDVTAVLGIFVVSNSAANPIIYLFFNSKKSVKAVCTCGTEEQKEGGSRRATSFSLMQKNSGQSIAFIEDDPISKTECS